MLFTKKIILASNSPRRKQIISDTGLDFEVRPTHAPEDFPAEIRPEDVGQMLAERKALAYHFPLNENEVLVSADTTVLIDNNLLEKPIDFSDAKRMLSTLSGRTHQVITGVCVRSNKKIVAFNDLTEVTFRELSEEEIIYYINTFKPYDKAGAYGAQDWLGLTAITKLNGSFYNVMGLPMDKLWVVLMNEF